MPRNVAVIVGSLRKESFSRKLANALAPLSRPALELKFAEIGDLPLYNEDLEPDAPAAWTRFREQIKAADAVLFVTPEYNRSVPGCLKNAIDVGSRPAGKSVWSGKPCAVVSNTPYGLGGFGANHHLRQCFVFLDMPVLQQPEAYIPHSDKVTDGNGNIPDAATREFMSRIMNAFAAWIEKTAK
ncbi:MAG TPA: NAD(P)H-dependent oxidoreductase [Rhizomicrobium sp.]|nr:NAD(P)H-dependent oxidoreductase [Rhizomicrobium sp.]